MVLWRVSFLPKGKEPATPELKVRPISAGSVLYRGGATLRIRQVGPALARHLAPRQGGAPGTPGAGTL
eukprot:1432586-Alexandrium_andersonii.AAC.1